jgi:hypothetical protein
MAFKSGAATQEGVSADTIKGNHNQCVMRTTRCRHAQPCASAMAKTGDADEWQKFADKRRFGSPER